jgi:hypothetical protein
VETAVKGRSEVEEIKERSIPSQSSSAEENDRKEPNKRSNLNQPLSSSISLSSPYRSVERPHARYSPIALEYARLAPIYSPLANKASPWAFSSLIVGPVLPVLLLEEEASARTLGVAVREERRRRMRVVGSFMVGGSNEEDESRSAWQDEVYDFLYLYERLLFGTCRLLALKLMRWSSK